MGELLALFGVTDEQAWADQSLCSQIGGDGWFPTVGTADERVENAIPPRAAKQVCKDCPVRAQCLQFALDHDERFGIWGGLTERERRNLQRDRQAAS